MIIKILFGIYLASFIWWLTIFVRGIVNTTENYLFNIPMLLISLIAGCSGMYQSYQLLRTRSKQILPTLFISFGLVLWGIGTGIYAFYNLFLDIAVPYPSLADIAYILNQIIWIIGMIVLSHMQWKISIRHISKTILFLVAPIVIISVSYYLLFIVARGEYVFFQSFNLKTLFDLGYLLTDVFLIGVSLLLLYLIFFEEVISKYRIALIYTALSFIFMYISDFSYSYTVTRDAFFVGSWVDLLYITSVFLLAMVLSAFIRIEQEQSILIATDYAK